MDTQPVLKQRKGISPVWILPIIALVLCAWLLYKSFMEAGIEIEVYFADASGLTPEKTQVMFMGLPIGVVKEMHPDIDRGLVKVIIRMDRSTEPYLVEDAQFWIVRPEISATKITGLETILTGSHIGVQRGTSTTPSREFMGLASAPPVPEDFPGLHIELKSSALRSIQKGSNIYFRNIRIGSVQSYTLEEDDSVLISCYILPQYSHLIHSGSRFHDASGVTFSGKLTNLKIRMESLASLLIGGIVVSTPTELQKTPPAENGDVFVLYEDFEAANYGIPMTLKLASGASITEGVTKVMYRGLEAGYVKRITINEDFERSVTAQILLDPRAEIILRKNTQFWMVSPEISADGVNNLNTLISGPYITFKPGEGEFTDHFEILPAPPTQPPLRPGKTFRLVSKVTAFSGTGAPVYYRKVKIGEILGSDISDDRQSVATTIFIYETYTDIITADSIFIKTGGISVDADFSGFSVNVEPLAAVLKGGIDVLKPHKTFAHGSQPANKDSLFTLYPDYDTAFAELPQLKPEGLYLHLTVDGESFRPGTPILYKKIKVGQILGMTLTEDDENVVLNCFIEKKYAHFVSTSSKFYRTSVFRVQGSLAGITVETESLETLFSGGITFFTPPGGAPPKGEQIFEVFESMEAAQAADEAKILVRFDHAEQLSAGAPVKYKGIEVGAVSRISMDDNLKTVVAELHIKNRYEPLFREHTKIWLATPNINLSGVKHLETVFFGAFVALEPGGGKIRHDFQGLDEAPRPFNTAGSGLNIVLETTHLGSIDVGSPLYYRQVKIGEVTGYSLAYDFKNVLISAAIDRQYAAIVRENSRFWNASGLSVKGGFFSGITVSTQSLKSILTGGIALATPGKEEMGPPVYTGYHFLLHDKPGDGWLDWSPDIFAVEGEQAPTDR